MLRNICNANLFPSKIFLTCRLVPQLGTYITRRCITIPAGWSSPEKLYNKLPNAPARTRFAPSPTGYLHLGSLRTALYNYLLARATGGQFLLRIEDTDQSRTVPGAIERICQDLEWTGLQWDEGPKVGGPYGPYIQSERIAIYRKYVDQLLDSGHAYRCFCTTERLYELGQSRSKLGLSTNYDRTCAGISKEESDERARKGEKHTVRLKAPQVYPVFEDIVYGRVGKPKNQAEKPIFGQQGFDDPILLKSDGMPTYHLANVVDDHLMKITHVVRAVEWMPSTAKHVYLYQAFGWTPPAFAHVGLLQSTENQKLSKRSGDTNIGAYRLAGVSPEVLLNFVALLGWHHKQETDIMGLEQMVKLFDFRLTKGNTMINLPKLEYLSREFTKNSIREGGQRFQDMVQSSIATLKAYEITRAPQGRNMEEYVSLILRADPGSYLNLHDFRERYWQFFKWSPYVPAALEKPLANPELLDLTCCGLKNLDEEQWSADAITSVFQEAISEQSQQQVGIEEDKRVLSGLFSDLRRVLFASRKGPAMALSLEILGKGETLDRLAKAGPFSGSMGG